jgi:hypothetical protein
VSTPSVTVGPPSAAAGARTTYTVAFSVSATGGLSGATGGTVTVVFPAGTGVNSLNSTSLVDVTTGKQVGAVLGFVSGTTLTFNVFNGQVISPNDIVNAIAAGATNPATPGTAYTVKVSTSSDTTPITSSPYTIVAGHPVKTLSVTVAPSAAAGARTGYTVAFTVSSTGGLSAATGGTVTVVFPASTGLNSLNNGTTLVDVTTGKQVGTLCFGGCTPLTFILTNGAVINAGETVNAIVQGATSPATPGTAYTVKVSTSSDTTPVTSSPYTIVTGHPVSTPSVSLSSTVAGATGVDYTVAFKASSTGGLSGDTGGSVTLVFPAGTGLAGNSLNARLMDVTTGRQVGAAGQSSTTTLTFGLFGGEVINAKNTVNAIADGVVNPGTAGTAEEVKVSTTSDTAAVLSCPYFIGTGPPAPCVTTIAPTFGPTGGGTTVTITGTNFTGATSVKFGSTAATNVVVNSDTSITATSPPGTGTADVTVTTSQGTSPADPVDLFKYIRPPAITTTSLPPGTIGTPYSATLKASGGVKPYKWAIIAGSPPAGLMLNATTGAITGTPSGPSGTSTFTVRVTDSDSPATTGTKALSIVIS